MNAGFPTPLPVPYALWCLFCKWMKFAYLWYGYAIHFYGKLILEENPIFIIFIKWWYTVALKLYCWSNLLVNVNTFIGCQICGLLSSCSISFSHFSSSSIWCFEAASNSFVHEIWLVLFPHSLLFAFQFPFLHFFNNFSFLFRYLSFQLLSHFSEGF